MNFEQKNGGEHCTADNSPQYVFHCDADENEFAGFILKNLPLVRAVARRFSGRGAEPEELVQAGSIGLIIAAKSFDKTRGVSFASYAFRFIEGEIRRFIRENTLIRLPRSAVERLRNDGSERASNMGCTDFYADGIGLPSVCVSLDEEKTKLYEFNNTLQTENFEERSNANMLALKLMGKLPPIEQKIIYLRYICDFGQAETALKLDLSQSTISKYEKRALLRMRRIVSEE